MGEGARAPEPITDGRLAGTYRWSFEVVRTEDLTPSVRRLVLTSPSLDLLDPEPGQDLMFAVPVAPGEGPEPMPGVPGPPGTINRRYSIRHHRGDEPDAHVSVDVVLHGDGPGARWAAGLRPGDQVEAIGPRGRIVPADAPAHLFVGGAAGAPALLAMLESLPEHVPAHAVLVVDGPEERQPTSAPEARVTWVFGAGDDEVDAVLRSHVSPGVHVYLAAERGVVKRWRALLADAGVPEESMSPKAYWVRGAANAGHGEPGREG